MSAPETELCKPEVYESKRIQLTSPILHIGSAVPKLNPFEYVQKGNRVYLPNQEALAKALHQRGRLQEYIRRIEDQKPITSLLEDTFGENWKNITSADDEPIFPKTASSLKWTDQEVKDKDLRPMIRNGMGQLYIPGSSIKGAIRTAIAYHLLKHANRYQVAPAVQVSEIERKLRKNLEELEEKRQQDVREGKRPREKKFSEGQKKSFANELFMKNLFSNFEISCQDNPTGRTSDPNTDFMRAIKVTDSKPLKKGTVRNKPVNTPVVAEVIVSSYADVLTKERFKNRLAKYKASIYAEMVHEVWTEFTITLDTKMLSWFSHKDGMIIPFGTIAELLSICKEFVQDQWEYERKYWQEIKNNAKDRLDFDCIRDEFYQQSKCSYGLRIGWASGMPGTTVGLRLNSELRSEIRDACGFPASNYEAPKSRRTVVDTNGEIKFAPGWARFKLIKQDS